MSSNATKGINEASGSSGSGGSGGSGGMTRRQILKGSTMAAAAGALGPFFPGRVLGANDRLNMAIIGIRSQGAAHIAGLAKQPNTRIKTFVDIDENLFGPRLK